MGLGNTKALGSGVLLSRAGTMWCCSADAGAELGTELARGHGSKGACLAA